MRALGAGGPGGLADSKSLLVIVGCIFLDFGPLTMKFFKLQGWIMIGLIVLAFSAGGCSRFLPPRKGATTSFQLVLDTRRLPAETLTGCFIPAIYPAITKIPIVYAQKVPPNAVFKTASVEVLLKNGDMKVLETVIEDNQVYLKFAVPSVDSFTHYNVMVHVTYEYPR